MIFPQGMVFERRMALPEAGCGALRCGDLEQALLL